MQHTARGSVMHPTQPLWVARRDARGLTLFELLLVLVILVAIFALVVPRMAFVAARRELHDAAAQVRIALVKARHRAMRSGQPVLFLYEFESPFFATVAQSGGATAVNSSVSATATTPTATPNASWESLEMVQSQIQQLSRQAEDPWQIVSANLDRSASPVRRLPRDVRFSAAAAAATSLGASASSGGTQTDDFALELVALRLPAIVFRPDGTTQDGLIVVRHARNLEYLISVRGLTGQVRVDGPRPVGNSLSSERNLP